MKPLIASQPSCKIFLDPMSDGLLPHRFLISSMGLKPYLVLAPSKYLLRNVRFLWLPTLQMIWRDYENIRIFTTRTDIKAVAALHDFCISNLVWLLFLCHNQKQLEEGRNHLAYLFPFPSHSIMKRNQGRKPEIGTEVEIMEGSFLLACSPWLVCFPIYLWTACSGEAPTTVSWALSQESLIKKVPLD